MEMNQKLLALQAEVETAGMDSREALEQQETRAHIEESETKTAILKVGYTKVIRI